MTTYASHAQIQKDAGNDFLHYTDTNGNLLFSIDVNGRVSYSGGVATAAVGIGSPIVVAVSSSTNLAFGAFAAIPLVAAAGPAGTYQLSITATVKTTFTTATSWLFTAAYTDDIHAQTPTVCTSSTMTANATEQGTIIFRSTGVAAITITPTAASADAGAIAYSATLIRIQ